METNSQGYNIKVDNKYIEIRKEGIFRLMHIDSLKEKIKEMKNRGGYNFDNIYKVAYKLYLLTKSQN